MIALLANLVIAVAKLIAGLATGSIGMLAESAHSLADSINEVLLGVSLRRDRRPADSEHPLGHGRERFLWAFMAALASFLIGGCLSIALAIHEFGTHHAMESLRVAWIVLLISFLAEGASWLQSVKQARKQAKEYGLPVGPYLLRASDPVVRAIVVEDSAALIGLCLAAGGLLLSQLLRSNFPDAVASLLIGILLAVTAFGLARPLADFLVGRSLHPEALEKLHALFQQTSAIEEVLLLRALYSGPEEVLVVAKIHPRSNLKGDELALAMDELDAKIRSEFPVVADVFIDVTKDRASNAPSAS